MVDLFDYINAAMQRTQCKSERKLCELIGISDNAITSYRRGKLPTDETMVKLAKLAGIEPWQALLDLQVWRSENENVKTVWQSLRDKIGKAALVFALIGTIVYSSPALAAQSVNLECGQCILWKLLYVVLSVFSGLGP